MGESEDRQRVTRNGWAVRSIENPSEEVKELAVQESGEAIQFIDNPRWIREAQEIESIEQVPVDGVEEVYVISLVGISYIYTTKDIRKL